MDPLGGSPGRTSPQTLSQGACGLLQRPKKGTLVPPVPFLVILSLPTAGDLLEPPKGATEFPCWTSNKHGRLQAFIC